MIKRISIVCLLGAAVLWNIPGQIIDQPVARVKLTKVEVVTQKQLKQQVGLVEMQSKQSLNADGRRKVLDLAVGDILITQAAARDNMRAGDLEVQQALDQYKRSIGGGNPVSDEQFKFVLQNQGVTYDAFLVDLKKRLVQEKYIMEKKRALFAAISVPSDDDVQKAYNDNATSFTNPLMVRYSHIFIDTRNLAGADRAQARKRADEALRELRANPATFKELAVRYSEDTSSKYRGGDSGYLVANDAQRQQLLGRAFFDAVFALKINEMSGVIESNAGFHIVQATERRNPKLLGLDDEIFPGVTTTVRDRIKTQLQMQKQQIVFQQAVDDILRDLRKEAEVTLYEQNLAW
jgi:peptidyl-prolyl cis-trans isomerase SurA